VAGRGREDPGWRDVCVYGEEAMSRAVYVRRRRRAVAITGDLHVPQRRQIRVAERTFQNNFSMFYKPDNLGYFHVPDVR